MGIDDPREYDFAGSVQFRSGNSVNGRGNLGDATVRYPDIALNQGVRGDDRTATNDPVVRRMIEIGAMPQGRPPMVSAMTALTVCSRFSASS